MKHRYSMVIRWSDQDNLYLVQLPDFPGQKFLTDGETYEEAARHGQEILESLIQWYEEDGKPLPEPSMVNLDTELDEAIALQKQQSSQVA